MAFLTLLSIADTMPNPSGVWEYLLLNVFDGILNYGWRIVVFTICLKLVLSPLDIMQRVMMRKNQKVTARIKPELDQLKMQYGHDRQLFAQKQMELNKREGISPFSMLTTCLPMIITISIFFWMLAGMRNMGSYMTMKQYVQLYDAYQSEYNTVLENNGYEWIDTDNGRNLELTLTFSEPYEKESHDNNIRVQAKEAGQKAAYDAYHNQYKVEFLWIKNVWSPDVPWKKPILEYDQFKKEIAKYGTEESRLGESPIPLASLVSGEMYDRVTFLLREDKANNKTNGLLIFPLLSVGLSFLQQFVTTRQQKKSGQQVQGAGTGQSMKIMMFMMPLMMGYFALSYTGVFTLYIFISTLTGLVLNFGTTSVLALADKMSESKREVKKIDSDGSVVMRYGRPDPNEIKNDKPDKKQQGGSGYKKK